MEIDTRERLLKQHVWRVTYTHQTWTGSKMMPEETRTVCILTHQARLAELEKNFAKTLSYHDRAVMIRAVKYIGQTPQYVSDSYVEDEEALT